ncbi:MAG: leucine-rich repeat domain-containing protein [Ruminococcus sp.]|nr:leucine-rich repeat domain-containing protein [Ruminococcus sp.]
MEKFEINENGCLTAYHNDNKKIKEIIIPDGVTYIDRVFVKYIWLRSVTLPDSLKSIDLCAFHNNPHSPPRTNVWSMTYRGVNFNPRIDSWNIKETIEMIANKDYSMLLSNDLKYPIVMQIYFNDRDEITEKYIKENFKEIFLFLNEKNDFETIKKLIKSGKFISKCNIETYIKIADEKECYEVLDILIEYKEENNF